MRPRDIFIGTIVVFALFVFYITQTRSSAITPARCPACPAPQCKPCDVAAPVPSLGCPKPPPCPTSNLLTATPAASATAPQQCPVCEKCTACPTCEQGAAAEDDDDSDFPVVEKMPNTDYMFADDFEPRDPLNIIYLHSPFHWPWHLDHWLKGLSRPVRFVTLPACVVRVAGPHRGTRPLQDVH